MGFVYSKKIWNAIHYQFVNVIACQDGVEVHLVRLGTILSLHGVSVCLCVSEHGHVWLGWALSCLSVSGLRSYIGVFVMYGITGQLNDSVHHPLFEYLFATRKSTDFLMAFDTPQLESLI